MKLTNRFFRTLIGLAVIAASLAATVAPAAAAGPDPRPRLDVIAHFDDGETSTPNACDFGADYTRGISPDGFGYVYLCDGGVGGGGGEYPISDIEAALWLIEAVEYDCFIHSVDLCVLIQSNWPAEAISHPEVHATLEDIRKSDDFNFIVRSTSLLNRQ